MSNESKASHSGMVLVGFVLLDLWLSV